MFSTLLLRAYRLLFCGEQGRIQNSRQFVSVSRVCFSSATSAPQASFPQRVSAPAFVHRSWRRCSDSRIVGAKTDRKAEVEKNRCGVEEHLWRNSCREVWRRRFSRWKIVRGNPNVSQIRRGGCMTSWSRSTRPVRVVEACRGAEVVDGRMPHGATWTFKFAVWSSGRLWINNFWM